MRQRSFTDEDVLSAVEILVGQSKPINPTNLRYVVGKGRPATIFGVYEELKEKGLLREILERHEEASIVDKKPLPDDILDVVATANEHIHELASAILSLAEAKAEAKYRELLALELANAEVETAAVKAELESTTQQLQDVMNVLDDAENKVVDLEELIGEKDAELKQSHELNSKLGNELAGLDKKLHQRDTELRFQKEKVTSLEIASEKLEKEYQEIKHNLAKSNDSNTELNRRYIEALNNISTLEQSNSEKSAQLGIISEQLKSEEAQKQLLTITNQSLQKTNAEQHTEIQDLKQTNRALSSETKELRNEVTRLHQSALPVSSQRAKARKTTDKTKPSSDDS
ncbi:hypothetical protein [Vibrio tritonius]|uniref:DNA-binding protein n=1 Tax=Vibrio tritonius TaxID=1435069 RepID=UPI00315D8262